MGPGGEPDSIEAWILVWLPGGRIFARPDGEGLPRIAPPPDELMAVMGRASRQENAELHEEALASWQEADRVISSLDTEGYVPLMATLGHARVLLALGRGSEARETLQVHISPGRCLRWQPTSMAVQLLLTLTQAHEDLVQAERFCAVALMIASHLPEDAPELELLASVRDGLTQRLAEQSPEQALAVMERQGLAVESASGGPDLYGLSIRVALLRKLGREPAALWLLTQVLQELDGSHPARVYFERMRGLLPPGPVTEPPLEEQLSPSAVKRIQEGELGQRLMQLIHEDNLEELRRLHAEGLSLNAPMPGMATPLMGASHLGRVELVRFLLSAGADVHARDESSRTALMHAADEGRAAVIRLLAERGAEVNALDAALQTALHMAAWQNHVEALRELLQAGAQVDVRDCTQRTPLMLAATEDVPEAISLLCEAGADIEAQDFHGNTALMVAAMEGKSRVAQVLLNRGAKAAVANRQGLTALDWARQYQHEDTVRVLKWVG
jgi:ankyrin repeat protein